MDSIAPTINEKAAKDWSSEARRQLEANQFPKWPHEVMVKTLFGGSNYIDWSPHPNPSWKVLDIGCFFLNNTLPFAELGCECYGIDIHAEILEVSRQVSRARKIPVDLKIGKNQEILYPSNLFNLLLSVGTIHYEPNLVSVHAALEEFSRVLTPGGLVFITTTGPRHDLFARAEYVQSNEYRLRNYDFRDDQRFFFFETEEFFKRILSDHFSRVAVGRQSQYLMRATVDQFFAICQK